VELLNAITKLNKLNQDIEKIEEWLLEVEHGENKTKPVRGANWYKLKTAINGVVEDLQEEATILERIIKEVADGLEVNLS
jgi:hypothetical protein